MTLADQDVPVIAWNEPDGLIARGTVIVIPGRGELPTVYERFGRRLAGDAYRVRAVAATVVLFLERIRQDSGPRPIAVQERLRR
jgi:hypothetical protein